MLAALLLTVALDSVAPKAKTPSVDTTDILIKIERYIDTCAEFQSPGNIGPTKERIYQNTKGAIWKRPCDPTRYETPFNRKREIG